MDTEVVDLFCGIGGLSAGFKQEGFRVVTGIDLDASCQYAFEENIGAPFRAWDVASIAANQISDLYSKGAFRVLVGCAPCQPFSMYTGRYRRNESEEDTDRRWTLLREFSRLITSVRPDVVSMENVPRVLTHPAFQQFVGELETAGYRTSYLKVRAQDYGVPQKRSRLVLFASRHGRIEFVEPTHKEGPITVRDAIGGLPRLGAGETDPVDTLHTTRGLSVKNLQRIRATREGGSWKDWDTDLQLACHKREEGRSFRAVYGRMSWDEPSPVITTQCLGIGNGRFGHPEQDRAISVREAALLQSFPIDYRFMPAGQKINGLQLARQIGNAVPVLLGRAIALSIQKHIAAVT